MEREAAEIERIRYSSSLFNLILRIDSLSSYCFKTVQPWVDFLNIFGLKIRRLFGERRSANGAKFWQTLTYNFSL
jgi:hypothetical protein